MTFGFKELVVSRALLFKGTCCLKRPVIFDLMFQRYLLFQKNMLFIGTCCFWVPYVSAQHSRSTFPIIPRRPKCSKGFQQNDGINEGLDPAAAGPHFVATGIEGKPSPPLAHRTTLINAKRRGSRKK